MHLVVAPVSGGAFPVQVAALIEIAKVCQQCRRPFYDLALAASGGNVAIYMAMAGHYQLDEIRKIVCKLSPEQFLCSWWPQPFTHVLPSWVIGCYTGTLYNRGTGIEKVFQECFTSSCPVNQLEVWTGTLNRSTGKAELFCNLHSHQSKLPTGYFCPEKFNAMPLNFAQGDVCKISKVCYASASIPVLVPAVVIDGQRYVDGGTAYSSPLTPLQDCIKEVARHEPLHIDYLSSYDLESGNKPATYRNLLQNGTVTLAEIIKSLGIQDRLTGMELLSQPCKFRSGDCNEEVLQELCKLRRGYQQSMLEIYPGKEIEISLEAFSPEDIIKAISQARCCLKYRLWWVV
jgi:hypothetical protein